MTLAVLTLFFEAISLATLCLTIPIGPGSATQVVLFFPASTVSASTIAAVQLFSSFDLPLLLLPPSTSTSLAPTSTPTPLTTTEIFTEFLTDTMTITDSPPTITVSASPTTFTDFVTVYPSPSTTWTSPARMTDLAAFNVSKFPDGQDNLVLVDGIPASASASSDGVNSAGPTASASASDASGSAPTWDNASSVLQLLYPADSINPSNQPIGGAEFYASPLELGDAQNASLEYSVFFPADFDWVLAGKLPGLYGGHTGCSGGDDALSCFSTRLMWRPDGAGELYLYAPKYKQTDALCSDPQSACDSTYGLSVGRGSFFWAAGAWTHVRQTVVLNTPGMQDGCFNLQVNGVQVISRTDVFYRDVPDAGADGDNAPDSTPTKSSPSDSASSDSGLLSPLLGELLRRSANEEAQVFEESVYGDGPTNISSPSFRIAEASAKPIGFSGLFFSTFFGGHEQEYATPRDQYVWFKDFAMRAAL